MTNEEIREYLRLARVAPGDSTIAVMLSRAIEGLLERVEALEAAPTLPDPPEHLADAWRRFQAGEGVEEWEARRLDEWRADCAQDAGF